MYKYENYRQQQSKRGLKRVSVWVPEKPVQRRKNYAEKLRKAAKKAT